MRLNGSSNIRSTRLRMEILLPDGVPALTEVGLLGLEDLSQLFDAFLHLGCVAIGDFKDERGGAAQVERHQRLQQVIPIDGAIAEGGRSLVDHSNPEFVGDMKPLAVAVYVAGQIDERLRRKKQTVDFPQIGNALLGGVNHAVGVDGKRFDTYFERKSEQRYLLVRTHLPPDVFVTLHQVEE